MNKYRVVIIDDEMLIRKLIRMKLDTEGLGLEIAGEFCNVNDIFPNIVSLRPDIILSDICMPGIDGISFCESCIKKYPGLKIILITGFNDFEFARRSIKAGVFDYLMKPVLAEELNVAVKRAIMEIEEQRLAAKQERLLKEQLNQTLPVLRAEYINELLSLERVEEKAWEKLSELGVLINSGEDRGIQIGLVTARESLDSSDMLLLMENEARKFFEAEPYITVIRDAWGRIIVVSNRNNFAMEECLKILSGILENNYGCHIIYSASEVFREWNELYLAYESALLSYRKKYEQNKREGAGTSAMERITNLAGMTERLLREEKITGARDYAIENMLDKAGNYSENTGAELLLFVNELRHRMGLQACNTTRRDLELDFSDSSELKRWLDYQMALISGMGNALYFGDTLIPQVLKFMQENICDESINLNFIADKFSVSCSHLSRLLKKRTGKNYVELMSDMRLIMMIKLINTTRLKDRDIGEKIGINDSHYLSIWFKKLTGYSPSEYRKSKNIYTFAKE